MNELNEQIIVKNVLTSRESKVPNERKDKVISMIKKWEELIWTEYHLWWILWEDDKRGIDCSHFVAYCIWLSNWQKENTWSLDAKYKNNEVSLSEATSWDLLMWPWHYDPDVKREIGHVEIIIWKTEDWNFVTLWASGLSRKWNKYTSDGEKLEKYNCVWFSVRNQEKWMRILRW